MVKVKGIEFTLFRNTRDKKISLQIV